jgi:hypothetical protein
LGGGLVTRVTPPVKSLRLRTMRPDVFWTPPTIEAAKAAPGKVGKRRAALARSLDEVRALTPPGTEAARPAVRVQGR